MFLKFAGLSKFCYKEYDTETDNASFVRCIDVMAKLIQKYGSTVLEQKESLLCATNSKAA